MKKTIFDLSNKELGRVITELFKTSYYKKISVAFVSLCLVFLFTGLIMTMAYSILEPDYDFAMAFIVVFGICTVIIGVFLIKMFDMLKNYYDEKNN